MSNKNQKNLTKKNHKKKNTKKAMHAFANLRDCPEAIEAMTKDDIIRICLENIKSTSVEIHAASLRLLSGITAHEIAIPKLIECNAIHIIAPFVRSPHAAFRKFAYMGISNYASHTKSHIELNDVNLVRCFLNTLADQRCDLEEMGCCLLALVNCSSHEHNMENIANSGISVMKSLIEYVALNDPVTDLVFSFFFKGGANSQCFFQSV